jgi:hypothetical protein
MSTCMENGKLQVLSANHFSNAGCTACHNNFQFFARLFRFGSHCFGEDSTSEGMKAGRDIELGMGVGMGPYI